MVHDPTVLDRLECALLGRRISRRTFLRLGLTAGIAAHYLEVRAQELEAIRNNQDQRGRDLRPSYDYVVVGSGSAACAVISRLAADANVSILVLEAGGWDAAPSVSDPRQWFTNLDTDLDWRDVAVPSAGVNNRAIPEHMAKVVGGGSSINATIWARPFKGDLDYWAEVTGDAAWGYERALDTYRRIENWQGTPNARYRGARGPVWCEPSQNPHPLAPAFLEACRTLKLPVLPDLNGAREEGDGGFAMMNHIIRAGQRHSMARAYLYPVLSRPNVTLLVGAHADRLTFTGTRTTGVEFTRAGAVSRVQASREVIVGAGGINTPKLLMLSGIGPEVQLRTHGIRTIVNAPEVGENFQDHLLHAGCFWEPNEAIPHRNSAAEAAGFWKSQSGLRTPDINIVQLEVPNASDVLAKRYAPPPTCWTLCTGLVAPKSRGAVRLRSGNPADRPIVQASFLSVPEEVRALEAGVELAREIGNSPAMRSFVKREVAPGRRLRGTALTNFVRDGITTYFHESGTCRMGRDGRAVVDNQLRVNGVDNLRIADSSIMPRIVSVATMATCVLIGERLAEILTQSR